MSALGMLLFFFFLCGCYPLLVALRANRRTSLQHTLLWTMVAWLLWGVVLLGRALPWNGNSDLRVRYVALVLTGCAGVAVLGARRPGMAAWNFVLLGLVAVLMLPLAQGWLLGTPLQFGELYLLCLIGTLAVTILNYLPTRLSVAALVLGTACVGELLGLTGVVDASWSPWTGTAVATVPWLAWVAFHRAATPATAADRLWLSFRDRFGFLWAQRVKEQFNNSMTHAGLSVRLHWSGMEGYAVCTSATDSTTQVETTLRALVKRFLEPAGRYVR